MSEDKVLEAKKLLEQEQKTKMEVFAKEYQELCKKHKMEISINANLIIRESNIQ